MLGIAAAAAGLVLFLPKLWDVLFDPLIGAVSDRTQTRWGRRQPFLVIGALVSALAFYALFNAPLPDNPGGRAWVMGLLFFVGMSGYAIFAVPYAAMPAEMSADPHERTAILSLRMVGVLLGTIAGAVAAPMIVAAGGGGRPGHALMGSVLAAVIGAAMLVTALGAGRLPTLPVAPAAHVPLREQLRLALANRPYFVLLAGYVLVLVGNGAMAAAAPYFVVQVLKRQPDAVGLVFASLLLAAMAAMPLWVLLARRLGKATMAVAAALVFGGALAALAVVGQHSPALLLFGLCALAGVGFAGTQLLPFSLLTDVIEADTQRSGLRREGSFTGLFIAGEKAGLAAGPMVTAAVLTFRGFVSSTGGAAVQPASAVTGVAWAFTLVPAAFVLLGAAVLGRLRP